MKIWFQIKFLINKTAIFNNLMIFSVIITRVRLKWYKVSLKLILVVNLINKQQKNLLKFFKIKIEITINLPHKIIILNN
jgi:hypothetical protein